MPVYRWVPPEAFMPRHIYRVFSFDAVADNEEHAMLLIRSTLADNSHFRHKIVEFDSVMRSEDLQRIYTGTVFCNSEDIYDWDAYQDDIEKHEGIKLRFD
jgi:hypothetical protein